MLRILYEWLSLTNLSFVEFSYKKYGRCAAKSGSAAVLRLLSNKLCFDLLIALLLVC